MTYVNDYENLGPLPENWESVALKKVVSKLVDGSHNPPSKRDSGFPMLSARNIENNQIVPRSCNPHSETENREM